MKTEYVTLILLLSIIGAVLGCGKLGSLGENSSAKEYSALLAKKSDLTNFQPNATSTPSDKQLPKIKGKVAIVTKDAKGTAELDRISEITGFSSLPASKSKPYYPPEIYAKTPDEIDTLIKIECREFKGEANYQYNSNSPSENKEFTNVICDVSVIDYKTKALLTKNQIGDERPPVVLRPGASNISEITEQIANYLTSMQLELAQNTKPTPSDTTLTVAEITKLYKTSKESVSKYQDKDITVTGWGAIFDKRDSILLYGNEKLEGVDMITCKIDPKDGADFAEMKTYDHYKMTVVGKFDGKYTLNLLQCRNIGAEPVTKK